MSRPGSFRERLAWSSLGAHVAVFTGYFLVIAQKWSEPGDGNDVTAMTMVLAGIALLAIAQLIARRFDAPRREARADEREQIIGLKASRIAALTLTMGVLAALAAVLLQAGFAITGNLLLATLVAAQIARAVSEIVGYKAGV